MNEVFQRTPGHLIRRCHQLHNAIFAQETAGTEVTAPQFAALRALDRHPGIDQTTLSRIIAFDRATIGSMLDRMEAKGWVRRVGDPRDRRARVLRLTPEGRRVLERLRPKLERVSERMLERLAPHERDQLLDLLERIIPLDDEAKVPERAAG